MTMRNSWRLVAVARFPLAIGIGDKDADRETAIRKVESGRPSR